MYRKMLWSITMQCLWSDRRAPLVIIPTFFCPEHLLVLGMNSCCQSVWVFQRGLQDTYQTLLSSGPGGGADVDAESLLSEDGGGKLHGEHLLELQRVVSRRAAGAEQAASGLRTGQHYHPDVPAGRKCVVFERGRKRSLWVQLNDCKQTSAGRINRKTISSLTVNALYCIQTHAHAH